MLVHIVFTRRMRLNHCKRDYPSENSLLATLLVFITQEEKWTSSVQLYTCNHPSGCNVCGAQLEDAVTLQFNCLERARDAIREERKHEGMHHPSSFRPTCYPHHLGMDIDCPPALFYLHPSFFCAPSLRRKTPGVCFVTYKERGRGRGRETHRVREHEHLAHVCLFSLQASSSCPCRQTIELVIKTNGFSAHNDWSAWDPAHTEKTAGHGTDGTRIASRTSHPVPRCLPPTSTWADEETVASDCRVSQSHTDASSGGRSWF